MKGKSVFKENPVTVALLCVLTAVVIALGAVVLFGDRGDKTPEAPEPEKAEYGYVNVADYVAPNTGEDVSAQIQQLIDENPNRTLFFADGEYILAQPICTPAQPKRSVALKLSNYAVLRASDDWSDKEAMVRLGGKYPANDIFTGGSFYYLEGGIIDAGGKATAISIDSGRETAVRGVSIKNSVVGIHIKSGANNGSSDADISDVNIVGTGLDDSVGIWIEGYDNTLTNIRIGRVVVGVKIDAGGNFLRSVHPLYYLTASNHTKSCGFWETSGDNFYDMCYSDQFSVAFRSTGGTRSIYDNCFAFWWSEEGVYHTAFKCDGKFNSTVKDMRIGLDSHPAMKNYVLDVKEEGGTGVFVRPIVNERFTEGDQFYSYLED